MSIHEHREVVSMRQGSALIATVSAGLLGVGTHSYLVGIGAFLGMIALMIFVASND